MTHARWLRKQKEKLYIKMQKAHVLERRIDILANPTWGKKFRCVQHLRYIKKSHAVAPALQIQNLEHSQGCKAT